MEIKVDKRIELMATIQTLDNYWDNLSLMYCNKTLFQCKYKENINNHFGKYKNHETVKLYSDLCNNIQDISFFIKLALCYSNPPEFDNIANINNSLNFPLETFINGLKQFYEDTNFEHFFANSKCEYEKIINDYVKINEIEKDISIIENYLDNDIKNYSIIISALLFGNFGIEILKKENIKYNYSVISPYEYKGNQYHFGSVYSIKDTLWHEIGHLTINELTKNYIKQFNVSNKIIPEYFIKHFYTDIESVVNEYIIRAITVRLFEINYKVDITGLVQDNVKKGFKEIEAIKNYLSKTCEENNKLMKKDKYIELMDYVINKI